MDLKPLGRDDTEAIKIWINAFSVLLVFLHWAWHRWLEPRADKLALWSRRGLGLMLGLTVVFSFANYSRFHPTYVWKERVDTYDLIHYYLNARYYDELGAFDLYPAVVLADLEAEGGPFFKKQPATIQFQDENDYYMVEYDAYRRDVATHARIRAQFGPEGWERFKHEFTTLQRRMKGLSQETWIQLLWDHGFNGAPAWVVWAQPLAEQVPVEQVKLLGWLDAGFLLVGLLATFWAFGPTAGGFATLFVLTTYSTRWPTISWAFGRYDWLAGLMIATALLKKGKPFLAGIFGGAAVAWRIFPGAWMIGPGFKGVWELLSKRTANRSLLLLLGGFLAVNAGLEGAAAVRYGGTAIESHFEDLFAHTTPENLSSMRQGFALATAYQGETDVQRMNDERRHRVRMQAKWRTPLAIALTLGLAWGLRRRPDHEAYAYGFIPFFLLATASYYYYVCRVTMVQVMSAELRTARNAFGLAFLFAIEGVVHALQNYLPQYRVIHIGWMGWLLTGFSVTQIAWMIWEDRRKPAAA